MTPRRDQESHIPDPSGRRRVDSELFRLALFGRLFGSVWRCQPVADDGIIGPIMADDLSMPSSTRAAMFALAILNFRIGRDHHRQHHQLRNTDSEDSPNCIHTAFSTFLREPFATIERAKLLSILLALDTSFRATADR